MALIKRITFALCLILLLVIGVVFTVRNDQSVAVDFLLFQTPAWSLGLWLLLSLFLGASLGVVASGYSLFRLRLRTRRLAREKNRQTQELQAFIRGEQWRRVDMLGQWLRLGAALGSGWGLGRWGLSPAGKRCRSFRMQAPAVVRFTFENYSDQAIENYVRAVEVDLDTLPMHLSIAS